MHGRRCASPIAALLWLSLASANATPLEPGIELSLPVDCTPGRTCFLQHYVDIDTGSAARDFRCGSATYDGHKGTDIRLLSTAAARRGVRVLAAAPGTVKAVRDSMDDAIARESGGKGSVSGVECGNGLLIDHGQGWETQYCHLRRGSLKVRTGERVSRGAALGEVGWSGLADFAHLHLTVRKDGKEVDPFSGRGQDNSCAREAAPGLWDETARNAFPYVNGEILQAGFTDRRFTSLEIERDHEVAQPLSTSQSFVYFARFMNLRAGDRIRIRMNGPEGFRFDATGAPLERNKQIELAFALRDLREPRWPAGRYKGHVELIRDGAVIAETRGEHVLP